MKDKYTVGSYTKVPNLAMQLHNDNNRMKRSLVRLKIITIFMSTMAVGITVVMMNKTYTHGLRSQLVSEYKNDLFHGMSE